MIQSTGADEIELTSIKELNLIDNSINVEIKTSCSSSRSYNDKQHDHTSLDQISPDETPQTKCTTKIIHRIKVLFLFYFVIISTGFIFIAAQMISTTASSNQDNVSIELLWKVDLVKIIFQLGILTAIVQFTMNASADACPDLK